MANPLFATKPLELLLQQAEESEHGLKRALGPVDLTMLGIGAIIGAGIFVLTGNAAAQFAGPAIVLSMIAAGIACAFAGLCYAEMATMIPIAGSAYTYSYATMGEFLAWIIGWDLILEYALGAATVSVGWSGLVVSFLHDRGFDIPAQWSNPPIAHDAALGWHLADAVFNVPAFLVVALVTVVLVIGIRESANVNTTIVFIKVGVLIAFIIAGISFIKMENWQPFIPENQGSFGKFGWSGILAGAGRIFFAYIGFDAVSVAAQECKKPQRDLPIGILASLVVCTILFVAFAGVLTGIVHYSQLGGPAPVAVGADAMNMPWLALLMKLGAIAGLTSVMLVMLLAQPRIFYIMSGDGLLPPWFSKIHQRFRTPAGPTILTGLVVGLVGGLFPIGILNDMVSIGTLFAFVLVCAGVWVMRHTKPHARRPFRTPLVPFVPIMGILCCLGLMLGLGKDTWLRLIVWLVIGLVIYFGYGRNHSKLRQA
jgi:APA family basic amino acid/polyamine antiporter